MLRDYLRCFCVVCLSVPSFSPVLGPTSSIAEVINRFQPGFLSYLADFLCLDFLCFWNSPFFLVKFSASASGIHQFSSPVTQSRLAFLISSFVLCVVWWILNLVGGSREDRWTGLPLSLLWMSSAMSRG